MSTPRSGPPRYKLYYFPARARGEVTRLIFKVAGVQYTEEIIADDENWPEVKKRFPTNSLPVLEMGGEMYPHSNSIVRWAARKFGLDGKTDGEQLRVEEVLGQAEEIRTIFITWFMEKDQQKKASLEEQLKPVALKFLARWEELAKETAGNQRNYTYMAGTSLTVADLAVLDILDEMTIVPSIDLAPYPKLKNVRATVASVGPIKQHLDTRPDYDH